MKTFFIQQVERLLYKITVFVGSQFELLKQEKKEPCMSCSINLIKQIWL